MNTQALVIDGNNVILSLDHRKGYLNCLLLLLERISSFFEIYPVVSREIFYRIDRPRKLKERVNQNQILVTPPNVDTDLYILEIARQLDAYVLSNDQYRQYRNNYSDVIKKRIPFMVFRDHQGVLRFILPEMYTEEVICHDKKPLLPA